MAAGVVCRVVVVLAFVVVACQLPARAAKLVTIFYILFRRAL